MKEKLIVLKLFLDELGIPVQIDAVEDRKRIQKAMYLGQLSGADLGYRYGWYLMGPYSPALTKDYYELAEAVLEGDQGHQAFELHAAVKDRLTSVVPLLDPPAGSDLSREEWLELLSSVHYLRTVRRRDNASARQDLLVEKGHLVHHYDDANAALHEAHLLS